MAEPVAATSCEVVPEDTSDLDIVLARFGGDALVALTAALDDIAFLRREIEFARLAMSYGFARRWRPALERPRQSPDE